MTNVALGGRGQARSIVATIVEIRSAANYVYPECRQSSDDLIVEFAFTVIAARAIVSLVVGILELGGLDHLVPNADEGGQPTGFFQLASRDARTVSSNRDCPIAQCSNGGGGHERA